MTEMHFLLQKKTKKYHAWSCQNVFYVLTFLLDNIFIRFGTKLYRQVVGIPVGTNCAPLVADLFLFCYERDFMMSLFCGFSMGRNQYWAWRVYDLCVYLYDGNSRRLNRKWFDGEAGNRTCDPWFSRHSAYPLHHGGFFLVISRLMLLMLLTKHPDIWTIF